MKNYLGEEHYIGYYKVPRLDWLIVVNTPISQVREMRDKLMMQQFGMGIILFLMIIGIGIYSVRYYLRPLQTLTDAFGKVQQGEYNEINILKSGTEFDSVVQKYNDAVRKLKELHMRLQEDADIDGLTHAYNRRSFDKTLELLKSKIRSGTLEKLGVILLDIDRFKQLNDTRGHLAGDKVLREMAGVAAAIVGKRSVFRYGGDEFAVMLRDVSREEVAVAAETIRAQSEKRLQGCTVSIGFSTFPAGGNPDDLITQADQAMYLSKVRKNHVTEWIKDK